MTSDNRIRDISDKMNEKHATKSKLTFLNTVRIVPTINLVWGG